MNNKMIKLWVFMLSMLVASNIFALNQLNCDELLNTNWTNTTNYQLGAISLKFDWLDHDPFSIDYEISYYNGSMGRGSRTSDCSIQPDGSLQLVMNLDEIGYLDLKTTDMNTFQILPDSRLLTSHDKYTSISGTFSRS